MDDRQAEDTVLAVEQTWNCDLGEAKNIWRQAMRQHDSLTAAAAILRLSERQRERPTIAELRKIILEISAEQEASLPPKKESDWSPPGQRDEPQKQFGNSPPEWTHIWSWMRFKINDFRKLPQQDVYGIVAGSSLEEMTWPQYEEIRLKWIDAGSPRVTTEEVSSGIAAIIANP